MKKHVLPIVMLSLSLVLLGACAPRPPRSNALHQMFHLQDIPGIVRKNTEQNRDDFKKGIWVDGPALGESNHRYLYLRAWANSNKVVSFIQLYVRHFVWSSTGFDFHSAYDLSGKKLKFVKIGYESDWARRYMGSEEGHMMVRYSADDAAVILSYKELVKHRSTGLSIKFYGKNGDEVYELPAVYIDDFLSVLEEGYTGLK